MKRRSQIKMCFLVALFSAGFLLSGSSLAQEKELKQELEKSEAALKELMQHQEELKQKLKVAEEKEQEGNIREITSALDKTRARMSSVRLHMGELRREYGKQMNANQRSDQRDRRERTSGDDEIHPEHRAAIERLEHMQAAIDHLRKAGMNDMAERVEQELREFGTKVRQTMQRRDILRNRGEGDGANRRDRNEEREVRRERENDGQREREARSDRDAQRARNMERERGQERSNEHMDRVIAEFSQAMQQIRREIRELRGQMEELKKSRDR